MRIYLHDDPSQISNLLFKRIRSSPDSEINQSILTQMQPTLVIHKSIIGPKIAYFIIALSNIILSYKLN